MATKIGDHIFQCPECGGDTIQVISYMEVFAIAVEFDSDGDNWWLGETEADWEPCEDRHKDSEPQCICDNCGRDLPIEDLSKYVTKRKTRNENRQ